MRARAVVVCAMALALAVAARAECPEVDVRPEDEHRYSERKDGQGRVWCEGRFAESTSAGMTVVGFGAGAAVERVDDALFVRWQPVDRPTDLRIRSRRPHDYYLLDAEAAPREASFTWPANVIDAIEIPERDLVVSVRSERGGHDALIPVAGANERPLRVAFLSASAFDNVTAELYRVVAGGEQAVPWEEGRDLGPVPRNQLFRIALPEQLERGLYRLKVIGETNTDTPVPSNEHLWIP